MLRFLSILVVVTAAGCTGSSSSSGVEPTKKLTALSSSERQDLCDYMVEAQGGVHSKMCGNGLTITVKNPSECVAGFSNFSTSCAATVDNAETCAEAAGVDLCNLISSPSCSFLFQCAQQ
jgi:hypothetical protein